jgi:hypothetical protein
LWLARKTVFFSIDRSLEDRMSAHKTQKDRHRPSDPAPRRLGRVLTEFFDCARKRESLMLEQCLTDYVNANALKQKTNVCFNCGQGLENRNAFAKGRISL